MIWAIADIHASSLNDEGYPVKPMEVFGQHWRGHVDRIEASWRQVVKPDDTVVIAGDLDWALHLADAVPTLARIHEWPGTKILIRGNHDYWWSSKATNKVRAILPPSLRLLHNNSFQVEGHNIVGAKGADVPGTREWTEEQAKLLNRETERLRLSVEARDPDLDTVVAMHYPPFYPPAPVTPFHEIIAGVKASACVYGHLHGEGSRFGPSGQIDGVRYICVASDAVDFCPVPVL